VLRKEQDELLNKLSFLTDTESVARDVWTHYIECLKTDGIQYDPDSYDWDRLDEIYRRDFSEAIEVYVCHRIQKFMGKIEQMWLDEIRDRENMRVASSSKCYLCSREFWPTQPQGDMSVCEGCRHA
jgi:hypothetical protein